VPEPTFAQPVRRNLLVPVLIAFLVLGFAIALVLHFTPRKTADMTLTRTAVYAAHTVFPSSSTVVGHEPAQDDLYVLTTLRVEDRLNLPLFIKDFTATLTSADGQEFTTSAVEKNDLDNVYTSFPQVKALATSPLLRDTLIDPGQSAEGMILLHFPVARSVWDHRRTAFLNVDLYHQGTQTILISRKTESAASTAR
jgi:hypothetical protein